MKRGGYRNHHRELEEGEGERGGRDVSRERENEGKRWREGERGGSDVEGKGGYI